MRLFIALDLSQAVHDRVAEAVARERERTAAKWVRVEGMHLTFVFLGEVAEEKLPEIVRTSTEVAARHSGFRLAIEGAGTFGSSRSPRVLWLGVSGALDPLQALVADLERSLGVVSDHPEYRPHLTLARSKPMRGDPVLLEAAERLGRESYGGWKVDHLTVYESRGGRYYAHASPPLG